MSKSVMVRAELDEIGTDDLIMELDSRGIYIADEDWEVLRDCADEALIDELENRGYRIDDESSIDIHRDIHSLYGLKRNSNPTFDRAFSDYVYEQIGRIL